jgi:hypothetical protein
MRQEELNKILELHKPEPILERRWIWLRDSVIGITDSTNSYVSDKYVEDNRCKERGWYKSEMYIDVKVKM